MEAYCAVVFKAKDLLVHGLLTLLVNIFPQQYILVFVLGDSYSQASFGNTVLAEDCGGKGSGGKQELLEMCE